MKLLLLRPQPGADASAERARAAGFDPIIAPLFAIEPVDWAMPDGAFDAIMITSANAIRHGGPQFSALTDLPVLAVGQASAKAACEAGFRVARIGQSNAAALFAEAKVVGFRALLWLTGEDHVAIAADPETNVTAVTVYRARPIDPGAGFADHLGPDCIVALHSPRAARHFAAYCDAAAINRATVTVAALSPAVADAAGIGWRHIAVADAPNDAALLSAAQSIARS